jgi:methylenetetrahydrofolate reductase (NADPH)
VADQEAAAGRDKLIVMTGKPDGQRTTAESAQPQQPRAKQPRAKQPRAEQPRALSGHAEPAQAEPARADSALAGSLRRRLESGQFAVTAEIGPPRGADLAPVMRTATALAGWVDAVNITDNQSASVRLSSLAGSVAAARAGVEPIMQLTCRDRNRIALQSELLSAAALGVPNVLIMTGDHPRHGDHTDAKAVFDLDSFQLLRVATAMRDDARLMSGGALKPAPGWLLGAVENPPGEPGADGPAGQEAAARRLAAKVEAGAQFVQTQFVFDVEAFAAWMRRLEDLGLTQRCHILAGVGPVRSARALEHLSRIPGVFIPEHVTRRLTAAGPEHIRAEGEQLCAELIAGLAGLPGLAGVHVMAIGAEHSIPGLLRQAGLPPRSA